VTPDNISFRAGFDWPFMGWATQGYEDGRLLRCLIPDGAEILVQVFDDADLVLRQK